MALAGFRAALLRAIPDAPPPPADGVRAAEHEPTTDPLAPAADPRAPIGPALAAERPGPERMRPWPRLRALRETVDAALPEIARGSAGAGGALDAIRAAGAELQRLYALAPDAMLAAPSLLDGGSHGTRHAIAAAVVLESLLARHGIGAPERRVAVLAALTMNVGMLELQETLHAQAGPLSPAQRAVVLLHPQAGVARLRHAGVDEGPWLAIVAQHHERLDGSGYPARLAGAALRFESQALMVVDRWCAMVSPRAYRAGAPADRALQVLLGRLGGAAEPALARLLSEGLGPAPPGTPVRLADGASGVVLRRGRDPAAPVVAVLRDAGGRCFPEGVPCDTEPARRRIVACIDRAELGCEVDPDRLWEAVCAPALARGGGTGPHANGA